MNFTSIFASVLASLPTLTTVVNEVTKALQTQTTPVPTPVSTTGVPGQGKPSDTVKTIQGLLNQYVKPNPPLTVDGWLGPRTEAAINTAMQMAKPYLAMFGVTI